MNLTRNFTIVAAPLVVAAVALVTGCASENSGDQAERGVDSVAGATTESSADYPSGESDVGTMSMQLPCNSTESSQAKAHCDANHPGAYVTTCVVRNGYIVYTYKHDQWVAPYHEF